MIKEDFSLRASQYSLYELHNSIQNIREEKNNTIRNTSQQSKMGLYFGKNSNEFFKYSLMEQNTEAIKINENKNDNKIPKIYSEHDRSNLFI